MANTLQSLKVPMLETGAAQLLMELSKNDISVGEIVSMVAHSPSIAAKLLSCANSSWSNPVTPVTTVENACSRLGLNVIRTTTIALAIGQSFDPNRCPSFDSSRFWCTSIIASNLAADLANQSGVEQGTARTTGLLHNIGLLWMADAMPDETNEALSHANANGRGHLKTLLLKYCGSDQTEASLKLYSAWKIPRAIASGLAAGADDSSDAEKAMARLITLTSRLASEIYDSVPGEQSSCPDDAAICAAYDEQQAELEDVRQMAATIV